MQWKRFHLTSSRLWGEQQRRHRACSREQWDVWCLPCTIQKWAEMLSCALCCQEWGREFHAHTPKTEGDYIMGPQRTDTRAPFSTLRITLS